MEQVYGWAGTVPHGVHMCISSEPIENYEKHDPVPETRIVWPVG
jgi:hypothetical protein